MAPSSCAGKAGGGPSPIGPRPARARQLTVKWTEGLQNIEIADIRQAVPPPSHSSSLTPLLGTWEFTYTLTSNPITDTWTLTHIETVDGIPVTVGTAGFFDDPVIGGRVAPTLPPTSRTPQAMNTACFGKTFCFATCTCLRCLPPPTARSIHVFSLAAEDGSCGLTSDPYATIGVRTQASNHMSLRAPLSQEGDIGALLEIFSGMIETMAQE